MLTILELETSNNGTAIKDIITALSSDTSIPETDREVFNQLNTDGYAATLDETLVSHYGERTLRPTVLNEYLSVPFWKVNIKAYLKRKAVYFRHCLEYISAEYNPIENVFGEEHEETSTTHGERHSATTDTDEPRTFSTEYDYPLHQRDIVNPQVITEEFTEANIITKTEHGDDTSTTSVSPFDDSANWYNQDKVKNEYGNVTETEQPYNRKFKTPSNTVSEKDLARKDTVTEKHLVDEVSTHDTTIDEAVDSFERDFSRHGNIGVATPAELIEKDAETWRAFGWLYDTAHDIANLISGGIWAL